MSKATSKAPATKSTLTASYKEWLHGRLAADAVEAAGYLNAALAEGDEQVFLLALRDVAEARGIGELAAATELNRESMYRMLSKQGNPRLTSLGALLDALGLRLAVAVK
jgi:probable addiction module antidote protein